MTELIRVEAHRVASREAACPLSLPSANRPCAPTRPKPAAPLLAAATLLCALLSGGVAAQSTEDIRPLRLGIGYAQILNMATAPELSSANYRFESTVEDRGPDISVMRLPGEFTLATLGPRTSLAGRITGGRVRMNDQFRFDVPPDFAGGTIDSRWSGTGLSVGLSLAIDLDNGWRIAPGLDVGYARLENKARYEGLVAESRPELDNAVFNWNTDAVLVTPSLGVQWMSRTPERTLLARAHVSSSWVRSRRESAPVLAFEEQVGAHSLRLERVAPLGRELAGRGIDWVAFGGAAGFYGHNRRALGFSMVYELGLGLQISLRAGDAAAGRALRVGLSTLKGSGFNGWTFVVGLQH